jgi:hypothetical protein
MEYRKEIAKLLDAPSERRSGGSLGSLLVAKTAAVAKTSVRCRGNFLLRKSYKSEVRQQRPEVLAERRVDGEFLGWDVRIFKDADLLIGRRFIFREEAIGWAANEDSDREGDE